MNKSWPYLMGMLLAAASILPVHAYSGVATGDAAMRNVAVSNVAITASNLDFNLTDAVVVIAKEQQSTDAMLSSIGAAGSELSYAALHSPRTSEVTFSVSF